MTHAMRGTFGWHHGLSGGHHDDWWKFGSVALITTAIGVGFVFSPLGRSAPKTPEPALGEGVRVEVVSQMPPAATVVASSPAPQAVPLVESPASAIAPAVVSIETRPAQASTMPAQIDLHSIDLSQVPAVQAVVQQVGGRVNRAQVLFADLTADGHDEAIVPITSDGSFGNLAFVVLSSRTGSVESLLARFAGKERRGLVATLDRGQLAETSAVYGPSDAACCPGQIVKTYYRWDAESLAVDRSDTIVVPAGKLAD